MARPIVDDLMTHDAFKSALVAEDDAIIAAANNTVVEKDANAGNDDGEETLIVADGEKKHTPTNNETSSTHDTPFNRALTAEETTKDHPTSPGTTRRLQEVDDDVEASEDGDASESQIAPSHEDQTEDPAGEPSESQDRVREKRRGMVGSRSQKRKRVASEEAETPDSPQGAQSTMRAFREEMDGVADYDDDDDDDEDDDDDDENLKQNDNQASPPDSTRDRSNTMYISKDKYENENPHSQNKTARSTRGRAEITPKTSKQGNNSSQGASQQRDAKRARTDATPSAIAGGRAGQNLLPRKKKGEKTEE